MRRLARRVLPAFALLLVGTTAQAQYTAYAITAEGQRLVSFNTATPGTVTNIGTTGASLIGIDFRPANGVLYGYNGDGLFTVNTSTGAATQIFDIANTTGPTGFDFNPAADRLRIVDATGTNHRINQLDGARLGDTGFQYADGGMFAGMVPALSGAAYTNNDNDPATVGTTLFGIDASRNVLVQLVNPNGGAANVVATLSGVTASSISGFDIVTVGGVNMAFLTALNPTNALSSLYTLNLTTGAASLVGQIQVGGGVAGLAIVPTSTVPEPGTYALLATGLAGLGLVARRRTRA